MAKRKNRERKDESEHPRRTILEEKKSWWGGLREETRRSILAIVALVGGLFFILAAMGSAGSLGNLFHRLFGYLFGAGYFLLPIALFLSAISLVTALRPNILKNVVIGVALFLLSSLALGGILIGEAAGGKVGALVAWPLLRYLDFWVSLLVFSGLFLVSILVMLNAALLYPRRDKGEGETLFPAPAPQTQERESPRLEEEGEKSEGMSAAVSSVIRGAIAAVTGEASSPAKTPEKEKFTLREPTRRVKPGVFAPPPLDLLETDKGKPSSGDIKANSLIIKRTLQNFGIEVEMGEIAIGPSVTQYTLKPAEGVKVSRILGLQNDLSLALAAHPLRIEAPIPGRALVGIEVPNNAKTLIGLGTLLADVAFQKSTEALTVALGKDVTGEPVYANVARMPHALIAGATGAGKSVAIHALITSLLYRNSPESLRMILVDPKRVELSVYNKVPHMLCPVITSPKQAILTLKWAGGEMDRRYDILLKAGARDVHAFHEERGGYDGMPYLLIVIDELADLMVTYPREMESSVVRLAQMSRAVGIHLVLSTQRPSVEVITGLIKANITTRLALQVASQIDSRTILDMSGAEKLLGKGDMLYLASDSAKPRRLQGPFISDKEIKRVVEYLAKEYKDVDFEDVSSPEEGLEPAAENDLQAAPENGGGSYRDPFGGPPTLNLEELEARENESDDELYEQAREEVIRSGRASTSFLQRRLKLGYARAARVMDLLEERGVVGPGHGAKPREVLIDRRAVPATPPVETSYGENEVL